MDIENILNIVKKIPADKLNDEDTIRQIIQAVAQQSGRTYSEEELDQYVEGFKSFAGDGSANSLIPLLLKKGIDKNQLDTIVDKIKNDDGS
jgi:uncharacterized protein YpuA (DUF1002 family)